MKIELIIAALIGWIVSYPLARFIQKIVDNWSDKTLQDNPELADPPADPSTCACGKKEFRVPYFRKMYTPLEDWLDAQDKRHGSKKLAILERNLRNVSMKEGEDLQDARARAESAYSAYEEEFGRVMGKVVQKNMLCRFCWHVVPRRKMTDAQVSECCFNVNKASPAYHAAGPTFFDAHPPLPLPDATEESE